MAMGTVTPQHQDPGGSRWERGRTALAVYLQGRMVALFFLGFSSGLPLALVMATLGVRLSEEGVDRTTIGLFSLVGIPYSFKFVWAPLMDRLPLPWLSARLGRRRSWILLTQVALAASIFALGAVRPVDGPMATALCALLVAFFSASQDIVIDALRVEMLEPEQQGAGAAVAVFGYRIGLLASGAGALALASLGGWFSSYLVMALLMGVGAVTVLLLPEPRASARPSVDPAGCPTLQVGARDSRLRRIGRALLEWLRQAVLAPLLDFSTRPHWVAVLVFVVLFKLGESLVGVMASPFYVEMGFSKVEIAEASKLFGLATTILGGFIGGGLVVRFGVMRTLLLCGLLQMFTNGVFILQAWAGHDLPLLFFTIAVDNLSGGMASTVFIAYLSGLCSIAYTATQYALLTSLTSIARTLLSSSAGWLVDQLGWSGFFLLTVLAGAPGLLLLFWLIRVLPKRVEQVGHHD